MTIVKVIEKKYSTLIPCKLPQNLAYLGWFVWGCLEDESPAESSNKENQCVHTWRGILYVSRLSFSGHGENTAYIDMVPPMQYLFQTTSIYHFDSYISFQTLVCWSQINFVSLKGVECWLFSEGSFYCRSFIVQTKWVEDKGPYGGQFLTSTMSTLILRSEFQSWEASHDPEDGANTKLR